jgi:AcrR family transcriptional regulator
MNEKIKQNRIMNLPDSDQKAPRWTRRKDARPQEILAAALDLFVERGYANTRAEDVAARAGVSKGTVFLYFVNKETLFKSVVRETIVPLLQDFRDQIEVAEASSTELIERFFSEWWQRFGSTKLSGLCKLVMSEAGNFPEVTTFFFNEVIHPNHELIGMLLKRGMASGEFRQIDPVLFAHWMTAPMVMLAISSHSLALCCPPEAHVDPQRVIELHTQNVLLALRFTNG